MPTRFPMPSEATRAWLYRLLIALQPIAVAYGVTTSEKAALWVAAAASALGFGLAAANTSTTKP